MKLYLVSLTVGANYHGLCIDLIVGVLMNVENNGMQGTRGFIKVQASIRIKTLRYVCVSCIMIS
jgi:hypothetical protein